MTTCFICHTDIHDIEPMSSGNFPICIPCVGARVIEIAEMKQAVEHYNENLVQGEALMTYEEMVEIKSF